jgi:hypothetical protein
VFSYDDDDDSFGSGQRLFRRPRSVMTADSDDSFMTVSGPKDCQEEETAGIAGRLDVETYIITLCTHMIRTQTLR